MHKLLAAIAALQIATPSAARAAESVVLAGTVVEVRTSEDESVTKQLRRVLPAAVRAASRWGALPPSVILAIHATHGDFEDATGRFGRPWLRAWARKGSIDLQSPLTWSRGYASDDALTQILAHELIHCMLFHTLSQSEHARSIPTWFMEGLATFTAGEHHSQASALALLDPAPLLQSNPALVYGTADRVFRDLVGRFGEPSVRQLLVRLGEGYAFAAAFEEATGVSQAQFEGDMARRLLGSTPSG
ncbi:MAG TPA: hypothetical protein VMK12_09300 [Anaeromyxobacteraceae bacterium]|nr:hypothetical protein [Anaeromyxobacteraceae bacterium]